MHEFDVYKKSISFAQTQLNIPHYIFYIIFLRRQFIFHSIHMRNLFKLYTITKRKTAIACVINIECFSPQKKTHIKNQYDHYEEKSNTFNAF